MKKVKVLLLVLMFSLVLCLSSCLGKYKDEAGVYEIVEAGGAISMSNFEYYTIELKANGDCTVSSKGIGQSQSYKAVATFEIEDGKIFIYTKAGATVVTEEYLYQDGKIIMDTVVSGVHVYAVFERNIEK